MKLIDHTKTKGARGVLLFAESAEDQEVNRGIFRLLSESQVLNLYASRKKTNEKQD